MTAINPTSGTDAALPQSEELVRLILSLNPDDKRAMARKMNDMARATDAPENAGALYRMADLVNGLAASDERAIKALGLQPGEGLA